MHMVKYFNLVVIERYAKFDGRAGRAELWWFYLAHFLVMFLVIPLPATVLGTLIGVNSLGTLLMLLYWLGTLIPTLAVAVRRLHDTNKSGWWILIGQIPFVGIVLFVFLVTKGDQGANQYGNPDPGLVAINRTDLARVAVMTDCAALQSEFDTAALNGDVDLMACINNRMGQLGCPG